MTSVPSAVNTINSGYTGSVNTVLQPSTLTGGALEKAFNFGALRSVQGYVAVPSSASGNTLAVGTYTLLDCNGDYIVLGPSDCVIASCVCAQGSQTLQGSGGTPTFALGTTLVPNSGALVTSFQAALSLANLATGLGATQSALAPTGGVTSQYVSLTVITAAVKGSAAVGAGAGQINVSLLIMNCGAT